MFWLILLICAASILGYFYYRASEDIAEALMTLMTDGKKQGEEGGDEDDIGTDNFPFFVGDHHLNNKERTIKQK